MQINEDKPYDDINITPMLDLAYVLLVIFILMTTASVQGMKVLLPRSSPGADSLAKPKMKAITVTAQGRISLDATPVSLQELEQKLQMHKTANPNFTVVVRGDTATAYQSIMDVFDVVGRLGITEVGLATKPRS
jgi:biopolymer transport protein ExbD